MKLVTAAIKPFRLEDVRTALTNIGVSGTMVSEVKGFGRQFGHAEVNGCSEYTIQYVPKVRVEVSVPAELEDAAVHAIASAVRTGKTGDGKIVVADLSSAIRVRTGEKNQNAL